MNAAVPQMSLKMAREVLGVSSLCTPGEVQAAFRDAAKRCHPDQGGDEAVFRQILDAYQALQAVDCEPPPLGQDRRVETSATPTLEIPPRIALEGGEAEHRLPEGRRVRIALPPGLRSGDMVRAAGHVLRVYVRAEDGVLVRGDDLWITARLEPALIRKGGRAIIETPLGRRTVWIDRKAAERGLVRLEGQGLPARGRHPCGALFVRLAAQASSDSAALTLLRRFAAAWAA